VQPGVEVGALPERAEAGVGTHHGVLNQILGVGAIVSHAQGPAVERRANGNEMAWVCENSFGTEPNVEMAYSIETFAWDDNGDLLVKTYYPMPESVGGDADPYAHILEGQQ
jgi:hypothetical protein